MKKNKEKVCPCGRIITDPNNKTGLCPKCQKGGNNILAGACAIGIFAITKKYSPKLVKDAINLVKNFKK